MKLSFKVKPTPYSLFIILLGLSIPYILYAASTKIDNIDMWKLSITLMGGLSLFLYGMEKMSKGMKASTGDRIRTILTALTKNRIIGFFVGMIVTTIIQSSSATTVLLVSFVQAGLMSFTQSLGVILGASVGTTITAQLIAFKLTDIALLITAIGFITTMFARTRNIKYTGEAIMGFGLLFFGMKLMSDAMFPLRTSQQFITILSELENPVLGILFGCLFTALIQSSSAFLGLIIVLAQQNLITLEAGIPLVIGTNIGTCITAGLASIGTIRGAKRVALAHVSFKILGALVFIWWIPQFSILVKNLSNYFSDDTARHIANAHTIYNVGLAFLFIPFTQLFAKYIDKLLPDRAWEQKIIPTIRHLDNTLIKTPGLAIEMARAEISRMAATLRYVLGAVIDPLVKDTNNQDPLFPHLSTVEGLDISHKKIQFIGKKAGKYLVKVCQQELSDPMAHDAYGLISISSDIESISETIMSRIVPLIDKKKGLQMNFSNEGKEEITIYHEKICKQLARIRDALSEVDYKKAKKVMKMFQVYHDLELQYRIQHLQRIRTEKKETVETHEIHMEIMDTLKQINVYAGNIAKSIKGMTLSEEEIDLNGSASSE